jgi:cytochrome c oxidase subunit I
MKIRNSAAVIPFFVSLSLIPFALLLLYQRIGIGYNPWLFSGFLALAVFLTVTLYGWMSKLILGDSPYEAVFLFSGALLSCFVYWKLAKKASFEWNWQDVWYVFSSTSILLLVFCLYLVFGSVYYLYAKRTTNKLNMNLTRIHFWISFLGISFLLWNHLSSGALPHPAQLNSPGKQFVYHRVEFFSNTDRAIITLLASAQLLFILNLIWPVLKSRKNY